MNELPLSVLFISLIILLIISGFFSGSETSLMSLNRYRLRHLVNKNNPGAKRAQRLLDSPDRLIGLILLGNNLVNILAASIATIIGLRLGQDSGVAIATIALTFVVLIYSEVTPKTLAARNPERFAFPASIILEPLVKLMSPFVNTINFITKLNFKLFGIDSEQTQSDHLSSEELRTIVDEAGKLIPKGHQDMLLSILDLEKVTVDDIMVPRNEIIGIDLSDDWDVILNQLKTSSHTRLAVFEGDIENFRGFVHMRNMIPLILGKNSNKEDFIKRLRKPYFIPENVSLHTQLSNFQKEKHRIGIVVNEYGDIQGLVTLEDILEEIVGEFTTDPAQLSRDIKQQEDGSFIVDASISIREINKAFNWSLNIAGPKTLNGLITEYLEYLPEPGTSLRLDNYPIEILQTTSNTVKTVLIILNETNSDSKEPVTPN
ncbi:MAG: HlyC/CorC family transporter [Gammaproteobacteria bacterium]